MRYTHWLKQDPRNHYFTLPNEIFSLGLESGAIAVYSYLLHCENRDSHQCWPSYNTIGEAVRMSKNTVKKYVAELESKCLITTEPTTVTRSDGCKRNGNLLYTIRPIREAVDCFYQHQMQKMNEGIQRQRLEKSQQGAQPQSECLA